MIIDWGLQDDIASEWHIIYLLLSGMMDVLLQALELPTYGEWNNTLASGLKRNNGDWSLKQEDKPKFLYNNNLKHTWCRNDDLQLQIIDENI